MYMLVHVFACSLTGVETRLREVSRQLTSSEHAREQLSSEQAGLRQQAREGQNWEREKQVVTDTALETEFVYTPFIFEYPDSSRRPQSTRA